MVRESQKKRKRKVNWALLRLIIDSIFKLFNLLRYCFEKKTILSIGISIIVVGVPTIVIPKVIRSKDPPPLPSEITINPEEQGENSDELTPEEPKEIQKEGESETQRPKNRSLSEQLRDMSKDVRSGTQDMEDMYQDVKAMNEDTQNLIKKTKKIQERLDEQPEN